MEGRGGVWRPAAGSSSLDGRDGHLCASCPVRMVASYLVHHSYCATAEAFAKSTDQAVHEELASIKNRQSESPAAFWGGGGAGRRGGITSNAWLTEIQKLVLSGRMGEAIDTTQQLYPNLLERNPDLLFMLK